MAAMIMGSNLIVRLPCGCRWIWPVLDQSGKRIPQLDEKPKPEPCQHHRFDPEILLTATMKQRQRKKLFHPLLKLARELSSMFRLKRPVCCFTDLVAAALNEYGLPNNSRKTSIVNEEVSMSRWALLEATLSVSLGIVNCTNPDFPQDTNIHP